MGSVHCCVEQTVDVKSQFKLEPIEISKDVKASISSPKDETCSAAENVEKSSYVSINKKKSLVSAKSFNKAASFMDGELDNDAA